MPWLSTATLASVFTVFGFGGLRSRLHDHTVVPDLGGSGFQIVQKLFRLCVGVVVVVVLPFPFSSSGCL